MNIMKEMENTSYTENGARGYKSTGKKLVDLNFKIPSFRTNPDRDLFVEALEENKNLALRWLLYLRDIHEGVGERNSFKIFLNELLYQDVKLGKKFLKLPLEDYGRWDDYLSVINKGFGSEVESIVLNKIISQLEKDESSEHPSLLAKWMPSENTSSALTRCKAIYILKKMGLTPKAYRKLLVKLRKKIDIVESRMSGNEWEKIDYEKVPSKANLIYKDAFYKHDPFRRSEYLRSLEKGEKKINAQAMFLHDIVHSYMNTIGWRSDVKPLDLTLEALWEAQKKPEGFKNTMVVRDGSGSMMCTIGNSNVSALDVTDALTLYCAENQEGKFKNYFMTFASNAKCLKLPERAKSLKAKLEFLHQYTDCSTTNIEAVFDELLETAIEHNAGQEDMPENILIISDMEFNYAMQNPNARLFKQIEKKYKAEGYKLPKLIFWNVNSRTNTIPLTENENGVILLSGFSKNLMSMVQSSELDCYKALVKELSKSRYDVVDKITEM